MASQSLLESDDLERELKQAEELKDPKDPPPVKLPRMIALDMMRGSIMVIMAWGKFCWTLQQLYERLSVCRSC